MLSKLYKQILILNMSFGLNCMEEEQQFLIYGRLTQLLWEIIRILMLMLCHLALQYLIFRELRLSSWILRLKLPKEQDMNFQRRSLIFLYMLFWMK